MSNSKAEISSNNWFNATDAMSDWFFNHSIECRMFAPSIYILFLQLSPISIFVINN